jgi:uncharacterized membrane protein
VRIERPGLQALRVAFSTAEVFCFYLAVRDLPLADVMTFWLAAPIYVAAVSPFLLGERVGARRWLAIGIGFVGVLVALTPSGAVSGTATAAAIFGSACFAAMVVTGRTLRGTPDTALVFWQLVGAGLIGAVVTPFAWTPPTSFDWALLSLLGVVAMLAHICVTRALKLADAALVAPLQYTLLALGDPVGLAVLRGRAGPGHAGGRRHHRGRGPAQRVASSTARRHPCAYSGRWTYSLIVWISYCPAPMVTVGMPCLSSQLASSPPFENTKTGSIPIACTAFTAWLTASGCPRRD